MPDRKETKRRRMKARYNDFDNFADVDVSDVIGTKES